ncbi:protein atonal homolog 7-like [Galendromus occidentalis]|uniref:Protein atonal homolog 7-like n=1 Tax=Galendromus occidentalis TaxID=34638 RepID=A0AAJ7L2P0_9ACAR|nr:protein atonal homolog 7-like [Galendromus occidentalis]
MEPGAHREHLFLERLEYSDVYRRSPPRKRKRKITEDAEDLVEKRTAANTMERRRMERLNTALDRLREIIPAASDKRVSKIKTLKMAIAYIDYLQKLLLHNEPSGWEPHFPYKYQQRYYEYPHPHSPLDGSLSSYSNPQ